jgi:hypothetical protein
VIPFTNAHGLRDYREAGVRLRAPWSRWWWLLPIPFILIGLAIGRGV